MTPVSDAAEPPVRASAAKLRVLDAAMRLFGERGYEATSIAQIEEAAGLRPGSGGLYRHFGSKRDVLEQGIEHVLASRRDVFETLDVVPVGTTQAEFGTQLRALAEAGMARLDHDRDLSRIMLRDLRELPDLARLVRRQEVDAVTAALAAWLRGWIVGESGARESAADENAAGESGVDTDAVASVVVSAISHYWTMVDATGEAPLEMERARFVDALVTMVERVIAVPRPN
ncbi:TetR/AcrR family transcriptional regulator [Humibacter sp. RRB41]|uniref:TetR/AcrR family transcriptional regulator n=1 Tax=Humibacter sp. RRB41 TaxID=2919946 RepID=UPI001FAA2770|nr:TetR/AcrR family transcriptional regulator [Humibacter sp. RRB41]